MLFVLAQVLKSLFEGSLLGDSTFLGCVSETEHPIIGLALIYGFILCSVVLLLNMIIAMMSKTFDKHYETATQEAAAQFASLVQDWEAHTDLPAPQQYEAAQYLRSFLAQPAMKEAERKTEEYTDDLNLLKGIIY